ncbi:hypothetical protein PR048_008925 [Dryococelus australis]|uniref:Uncharacterized protein n=1 Tax=Dryococelus australis TaxID=614101 RepID=A0ABQ9HYG8_9NEOP|nr:hypothetical protein PR048_008925 [Dryococelus australis]
MSSRDLRRNTQYFRSYRQSEVQIPKELLNCTRQWVDTELVLMNCHEDHGEMRGNGSPDFKGCDNGKCTGYVGNHVERNLIPDTEKTLLSLGM